MSSQPLGCCRGGLPPSPPPAREGGMLGRDGSGEKEHFSVHLPKTDFICFEDLFSLLRRMEIDCIVS